ncbi:MAG: ribonuclease III [Alistipes sp.]|nr:ribonuclease III [Alistipes sp.]
MLDFILRPIRRNFGRNKLYYRAIDDMFGFIPNNIELYKVALIHKSASIDVEGQTINNERLEFLGDAVIESITSDYLFIEYPHYDEGKLTKLRSKLVSRQSLNAIACKLGLDKLIICSHTISATQKHLFGDAFEAMMGAIYLDQGYNFANRLLINNIYSERISLEEVDETETDFKSRLIEWGQKNHHTVVFRTKAHQEGSHRDFRCTILIDNLEVGHGIGSSKKEAEQSAAQSVSHEPSDEACARLLDRIDKLER